MTLPYAFTDPTDNDQYGMTHPAGLIDDQTAAEAAGYACGTCLDTFQLDYTDHTSGPCPTCQTTIPVQPVGGSCDA